MEPQTLASRVPILFSTSSSKSPERLPSQDYIIGLRGLFVLQSFVFVFFQTFLPTALPDSANQEGGREYQHILRKTFSVLFANESLIYSWFIFLSARTLALPYLNNTTREVCASSVFRRGIRLWLPTFIAFSLSAAAFSTSTSSTETITSFLTLTKNISTSAPLRLRSFLVYFNALFDLFWVTKSPAAQAANAAFPSATLWIVSVLFQQSYTVYMTMTIVPYTRASWRLKALLAFIVGAFWVQSWAWYSVSGLLIADAVLNMDFATKSRRGVPLGRWRVPLWPVYALLVVGGFLLQYLFVAWRPALRDRELYGHTGLYTQGVLNEEVDVTQPLARMDNYLIMLGTMLLIETFDAPRRLLASRFCVALGNRSLSKFASSILCRHGVANSAHRRLPRSAHRHLHSRRQAVDAPRQGGCGVAGVLARGVRRVCGRDGGCDGAVLSHC
jgi:hypothetical protein